MVLILWPQKTVSIKREGEGEREREREPRVRVASKGQRGDGQTLEKASTVPPNKIRSPHTAPNVPRGEIDQLHRQ